MKKSNLFVFVCLFLFIIPIAFSETTFEEISAPGGLQTATSNEKVPTSSLRVIGTTAPFDIGSSGKHYRVKLDYVPLTDPDGKPILRVVSKTGEIGGIIPTNADGSINYDELKKGVGITSGQLSISLFNPGYGNNVIPDFAAIYSSKIPFALDEKNNIIDPKTKNILKVEGDVVNIFAAKKPDDLVGFYSGPDNILTTISGDKDKVYYVRLPNGNTLSVKSPEVAKAASENVQFATTLHTLGLSSAQISEAISPKNFNYDEPFLVPGSGNSYLRKNGKDFLVVTSSESSFVASQYNADGTVTRYQLPAAGKTDARDVVMQQIVSSGSNTFDQNGRIVRTVPAGSNSPSFEIKRDASGSVTGFTYQGAQFNSAGKMVESASSLNTYGLNDEEFKFSGSFKPVYPKDVTKENKNRIDEAIRKLNQDYETWKTESRQDELDNDRLRFTETIDARMREGGFGVFKSSRSLTEAYYFLEGASRVANDFSGFSSLFASNKAIQDWKLKVDQTFQKFTTAGWVESICAKKFKQTAQQTAFVKIPGGAVMPAATVAAECTPVLDSLSGNQTRMYKFTIHVSNPQSTVKDTPMRYNVRLFGSQEIDFFNEQQALGRGESFTLDKEKQPIFSNELYNKICIIFEEPPEFFKGSEVCNKIICRDDLAQSGYESLPTSAEIYVTTTQRQAAQGNTSLATQANVTQLINPGI